MADKTRSEGVFDSEAFRLHMIEKHNLGSDSEVFCASVEVYYGIDLEDRGPLDGNLLQEELDETRAMLPTGTMMVGMIDRVGGIQSTQSRYFIENVAEFFATREAIAA